MRITFTGYGLHCGPNLLDTWNLPEGLFHNESVEPNVNIPSQNVSELREKNLCVEMNYEELGDGLFKLQQTGIRVFGGDIT